MDETFIGMNAQSMDISPAFLPYGKVVVWYDDENAFSAQVADYYADTHRTLEVDCPDATQTMANNILTTVSGYAYKPYKAAEAIVDPAAELGDAVTINGLYSGLYEQEITFNALFASGIGAPQDEEIEHEYPYADPVDRALSRKVSLGTSYYGTKITREQGLVVEHLNSLGQTDASVVLNANELAFYNGGQRVLYFDAAGQKYVFNGDIIIQAGSIEWADLSASAQQRVDYGKGDANPSYIHSTYISSTEIRSPTIKGGEIYGGKFGNLSEDIYIQMEFETGTQWQGGLRMYYPDQQSTPVFELVANRIIAGMGTTGMSVDLEMDDATVLSLAHVTPSIAVTTPHGYATLNGVLYLNNNAGENIVNYGTSSPSSVYPLATNGQLYFRTA